MESQNASSEETSDLQVKRAASLASSANSLTEPIYFSCGGGSSGTWKSESARDDEPSVDDDLPRVLEKHKTIIKRMRYKYESLCEGINMAADKTPLNRIYTQLYITEGETECVNEEHEIIQIEKTPRNQYRQGVSINCNDIFKPLFKPGVDADGKGEEEKPRTVLTKGIAGIGKTVSVHKFIIDWAEGRANQDVDFIFVLPFRELNLIKDDKYSLHRLLCEFHPEIKDLSLMFYKTYKLMFVFDGLDESRISMNFLQCENVSDITVPSSVGVLMSNLIKGYLLPSAHIWITSRPAAANQIPSEYINRVTKIQGFSDPQKEEYFEKRISDKIQAQKIISHIKNARSLYIMCHIPVFCWISATVLQETVKDNNTPKTLTEMYTHFLFIQTNIMNKKYGQDHESDPNNVLVSNRKMLLRLAKLAFRQLVKGNVMFYKEDLKECNIDDDEKLINFGICSEFKQESALYQKKVYCFVHLSFQEFLAAFYVFHCYLWKNTEVLMIFKPLSSVWSENVPLDELLIGVVNKALESQNGQFDLFLRFLLGISLQSNQRLLQGLLAQTQCCSENISRTVQCIKGQIQTRDLPNERSISLFLGLNEIHDQSLSIQIEECIKSGKEEGLSPAECSMMAYKVIRSEVVLDELDLNKFHTSEEGYRRLMLALSNCRKAVLTGCNIKSESCEIVTAALQYVNSPLRELDISNNDLQDAGVKLLSAGLKSSQCKLEILRLALCYFGEKTCENLASVLQSANCPLRELELSNNDLQDSGVKLLSAGLRSSHCKLEILRLSGCLVTEEGCSYLASALISNPSYLKGLDLTYNHPGDSGVKLLSARLEDPHCKLDTLRVEPAGKIYIKLGLRKYAHELTLDPNTAHTHLSLSDGNRKMTCTREQQLYPDHSERFDYYKQVLCRELLSGRCYWEVEWSGRWGAAIVVTYNGIRRKGCSDESLFGYNAKSWSFFCSNNSYSICHSSKENDMPCPPSSSRRVGVFLDWQAGKLSCYSVSSDTGTLTHLHTIHCTFTEPLYAGFGYGVWGSDSSLSLCQI